MSREFSSANWSPQKNNFCHAFPEFCRASTRNNLLICSPLTPEIQFQTSECYLIDPVFARSDMGRSDMDRSDIWSIKNGQSRIGRPELMEEHLSGQH
jgi:hypothetical protein